MTARNVLGIECDPFANTCQCPASPLERPAFLPFFERSCAATIAIALASTSARTRSFVTCLAHDDAVHR